MAVNQEVLTKIADYEKQGYSPDEIVAGLAQSQSYRDVAAKVNFYKQKGYTSDEILGGIRASAPQPEEHPLSGVTPEARMKAMNPDMPQTPEWAGKHPNLYAGVRTARDIVAPVVEGVGLVGGGIVGSGAGLVGAPVGAGLGYAGAKRLVKGADVAMGFDRPETASEIFAQTGKNIAEGAAMEAGGQVIGKVLPPVAGYVGEKAQGAAKGLYKSAAKIPTTLPNQARTKIAETALKERIMPTEAGLGKLAQKQRDIIGAVDEAVNAATAKGSKIDTNKILANLYDAYEKARLSDDPVGYTKIIDDVAEKFKAHGDTLSVKDAHQIKQNIYKLLPSKAYEPNFAASERMAITGRKAIGRGTKEAVEIAAPGVKQMNAKAKELIDLSEVLNRTVNRVENNNLISLNTDLAAMIGAQISGGGGAAVLGATRGVLGMPRVKARIAMALYKSGGQLTDIAKIFGETPAGQQMIKSFRDSKTQAILKSGVPDQDKERFLTKIYEGLKKTKGK